MKTHERKIKANRSGQLLIIAALAIAILISSTTIYVYELTKETTETYRSATSDFVHAVKQAAKNTMMSSLANISNGGNITVLKTNLDMLANVLFQTSFFGICELNYTAYNGAPYDSGILISWNTSNIGISSAYANFTLKIYSIEENITINYALNITTAISINGFYTKLSGDTKLVSITCKVYSDGLPALAKNLTLFYKNLGTWIRVDSSNNLSIIDYGNGTYQAYFTAEVHEETIQVSTHIFDCRNIFVRSNTTCNEA